MRDDDNIVTIKFFMKKYEGLVQSIEREFEALRNQT